MKGLSPERRSNYKAFIILNYKIISLQKHKNKQSLFVLVFIEIDQIIFANKYCYVREHCFWWFRSRISFLKSRISYALFYFMYIKNKIKILISRKCFLLDHVSNQYYKTINFIYRPQLRFEKAGSLYFTLKYFICKYCYYTKLLWVLMLWIFSIMQYIILFKLK